MNDQTEKDVQSQGEAPELTARESVQDDPATAWAAERLSVGAPRAGADHRATTLQRIFLGLAIAVIGFGGGWLGGASRDNEESTVNTQRIVLDEQGDLISKIAEEVGQSVVSVNVTSQAAANPFSFFGGGTAAPQQSAGTGIILSENGLIVTNRHVVPEGATSVSVVLSDGKEYKDVRIIGRTRANESLDIAFLQIKDLGGDKLKPAKIGNSSDMAVGDSVIAIGNALGQFQNTVTTGIVSGYGRSVVASSDGVQGENLDDLFQTDAAINQGNSGGPLVNLKGEVIGINTAVADSAENIGFSIPIDNIKGLIKSVETTGELRRPYLGIVFVNLNDSLVAEYDLKVKEGAFIPPSADYGRDTLIDGAPADKAGIREGDVITKVNDRALTKNLSLASILGQYTPDKTVKVTVNRNGKTETFEVKLGTLPEQAN